jgi:phosphohistidine phosphatase
VKLYLVRHGEPVPSDVDPQRPLSEKGRAEVQGIGRLLRGAGVRVDHIVHSGKRRAEETAALLAEALGNERPIEQRSGLDPLDPVDPVAGEAAGFAEDTMLVGHLPFMARLVSRLTAGDEDLVGLLFRPGTVVCLVRTPRDHWGIEWVLPPALLGGGDAPA